MDGQVAPCVLGSGGSSQRCCPVRSRPCHAKPGEARQSRCQEVARAAHELARARATANSSVRPRSLAGPTRQ
jgi:hypothetical protein